MATSLNVIRTLTIRAKTEGMDQATSSLDKFIASTTGVAQASAGQEKATLSVERAYQRLQRQLDQSFKSQEQMARAIQTLTQAQQQGLATQERTNQLMALAEKHYGATAVAVHDMAKAMSESSMAAQQNAAAMEKITKGMSDAGRAANTARAAFTDIVKGMSSFGSAALESSRATEQMTKGMTDAGRAAVPASRAFTDMVKGMSSVGRGALESSRASEQMIKGMSGLNAAAQGTGSNFEQMAKRTTLARYELINLSRQIQDVVVSLASGQNPFTVFIQQGSQIADIAQTSGVGLRGMASSLAAIVGPLGLVAIGIAAVVAGFTLAANSWKKSALELDNLAKFTGIAIDQLRGLEAAAKVKGVDEEDFAKGIKAFSEQVTLAQQGLGDLNELLRRNGETVDKDVVTNLMKVADLIARAKDEQQKLQILQDAGLPKTQEFVRLMEQGGDAVRDAAKAMEGVKIDQDMIDKARAFDEAWANAWKTFKVVAFDVVGAVIGFLGTLIDKAGAFVSTVVEGGKALLNLVQTGSLPGASFAERFDAVGGDAKFFADTSGRAPVGVRVGAAAAKPVTTSVDLKAMEQELSLLKQRARFLGENASTELKMTIARKEAAIAQEKGVTLTKKEIEEYAEAQAAGKGHSKVLKEIKEDYSAIEGIISGFGNTLINSMLDGATATEALGKALEGVGKQLINIATTDIAKALAPSISGLLGSIGGGIGGSLLTGVAGIGISLIGKLIGGNDEDREKLQAQQAKASEELKKAKEAWANMTDEVQAFNRAAAGLKLGELTSSIADLFRQAEPLIAAAARAGETAGSLDVSRTLSQGINRLLTEFARDVERLVSEFGTTGPLAEARKQVDQLTDGFDSLTDSIREFGLRTGAVEYATEKANQLTGRYIESLLALVDAGTELSETAQQIADVNAKAAVVTQALVELGIAADEAAAAVQLRLAPALKRLGDDFIGGLIREVNELAGGKWINEAQDLFNRVKDLNADAATLGIQTTLIQELYVRSAQKIVDENELVGDSFLALQRMLGLAGTSLHEFNAAIEETADVIVRSAQEISDAIQANEDRLFLALNRGDSLQQQLARFDLAAQREREAEVRAGGQALASLERALAQERVNIITDFAQQQAQAAQQAAEEAERARQQAIDAERRAAEEKARILKEAVDFIAGQVRRIEDFIADFLSGPDSILKPSQQLLVAQQRFASELSAAAGGNRDALQNITGNAQNVIDAIRRYYASSTTGQTLIQQVIGSLQGLPALLSPEEFIVEGLTEPIDNLGGTITDVTDEQTDILAALLQGLKLALETGDAQAFAIALLPMFDRLDTTMDQALSFQELVAGLGADANLNTLRSIFTELDTNGDQLLQKEELIRAATAGTAAGVTQSNSLLDTIRTQTAFLSFIANYLISINLHVENLAAMRNSLATIAAWAPGSNHAAGGWITGGTPGRDSVSGMLMPGEFVVRESVARQNPWLSSFNETGRYPANDNGNITAAIVRVEHLLVRGFKALIETELEAAGLIAKPIKDANRITRTRRGEKKKSA